MLLKNRKQFILIALVLASCAPKAFLINQPGITSIYFERKIKKLETNSDNTLDKKREIVKTKIEYGFGVIMEEADRLIEDDYYLATERYEKANKIFKEARENGLDIIINRYPNFIDWLRNKTDIIFNKNDIVDLYWLAAAYGGAISSSRANPFELIHLPYVGKMLNKCISLDAEWNEGALYSAKMSFTSSRSDLSEEVFRDSLDYYFDKTVSLSDGMNAGPYITYAESVHKLFQEKKEFLDKLNYVMEIDVIPNSKYELSNLIAKSRAKWLLTKTDEYFIE